MSKAHKANEKKNIYACLAQRDTHVTPSAMKIEPLSPITSRLDFTQQYIPQTSHLKGLFCLISHAKQICPLLPAPCRHGLVHQKNHASFYLTRSQVKKK